MTDPSPVVPSVGAVPVEVPEAHAHHEPNDPAAMDCSYSGQPLERQASDHESTLADGHTITNTLRYACWLRSHDSEIAARVRAEERQRIEVELIRRAEAADRADLASIGDALDVSQCRHGHRADTYRAAARMAAGSAVPVATPVVAMHGDHGFAPGVDVDMAREGRQPDARWCNNCGESIAGPVATPVEPVDEVVCPNCEHTIRARMSDQPGPCTSECGKPADQTCLQWACRKAGADLAAPAEQDGQR